MQNNLRPCIFVARFGFLNSRSLIIVHKTISSIFGNLIPMILVLIVISVISPDASAKVTVNVIEKNHRGFKETTEIKCLLQGGTIEEPKVSKGMELNIGDELSCMSQGLAIQLKCGINSFVTFKSPFRVIIIPAPDEKHCALMLTMGSAEVSANDPTIVLCGGMILGTKGTQYSVAALRTDNLPVQQVAAYESDVFLRTSKLSATAVSRGPGADLFLRTSKSGATTVRAGHKVVVGRSSKFEVKPIDRNDIEQSADVYARIDLAVADVFANGNLTNRDNIYMRLRNFHGEVLSDPTNVEKRLNLSAEQINNEVLEQAIANLNQATKYSKADDNVQKSKIAFLMGIAYISLGQTDEGRQRLEQALQLNPDIYNDKSMKLAPAKMEKLPREKKQ